MSRWPFLLKHLSYSLVNLFNSFHTRRKSVAPTLSNSLDHYTPEERGAADPIAGRSDRRHVEQVTPVT